MLLRWSRCSSLPMEKHPEFHRRRRELVTKASRRSPMPRFEFFLLGIMPHVTALAVSQFWGGQEQLQLYLVTYTAKHYHLVLIPHFSLAGKEMSSVTLIVQEWLPAASFSHSQPTLLLNVLFLACMIIFQNGLCVSCNLHSQLLGFPPIPRSVHSTRWRSLLLSHRWTWPSQLKPSTTGFEDMTKSPVPGQ